MGIMLFIEMSKLEFPGGHIEIMLIIDIAKIDLTGGHIGIMLFIEISNFKINQRPNWNYSYYRHYQKRINQRTH